MKKIVSMLLLQMLVLGFLFGTTINSKEGYKELPWGSTVEDAEDEGYKLAPMDKSYLDKLYAVPVEAYKVTSKDRNVSALQFHYYMGNLFFVSETVTGYELNPQKLAGRYGNFNQRGIFLAGKQYTDAKFANDGSVVSLSISLSANSSGNITATMYDWNTYRFISFAGQKLANRGQKLSRMSIEGELEATAKKLLDDMAKELASKKEQKLAFYPLTTDYKNIRVEDYVTDALQRAIFDIGKDKLAIYERSKLETVLEELHFQERDIVDQNTAISIGQMVGVDFVCYGSLNDWGDKLTVNASIVSVRTGRICAMSGYKIKKDDYLKKQPQSAVGERKSTPSSKTSKTSAATAPVKTSASAPAKTTTNNAWKVTNYNDDFGGTKVYVFTVNSSDTRMLFIRYQKANNPANSKVIAGIHWVNEDTFRGDNTGNYDIKATNGTVVSKKLSDGRRLKCFLNASETKYFHYAWNSKEGARWLVEMMKKSDSVAVRGWDGLTRRFQTAGLLDKMAEYGITWKEIDDAIANEEF